MYATRKYLRGERSESIVKQKQRQRITTGWLTTQNLGKTSEWLGSLTGVFCCCLGKHVHRGKSPPFRDDAYQTVFAVYGKDTIGRSRSFFCKRKSRNSSKSLSTLSLIVSYAGVTHASRLVKRLKKSLVLGLKRCSRKVTREDGYPKVPGTHHEDHCADHGILPGGSIIEVLSPIQRQRSISTLL